MACRILQLPQEVLLNIINTFRRTPPSYRYRTLPFYAGKSHKNLAADRSALSNITLTCKVFFRLSKAALYEHFTPFEVWPGVCSANCVSKMQPVSSTSGLRLIRYLCLEVPQNDQGRNIRILQTASVLTRLHLSVMLGPFQEQDLGEIFSSLEHLETVTLSSNHSPDLDLAVNVYKALSRIPNLRALSLDTVNGIVHGSHSLGAKPLEQLELRDIEFQMTQEVRYILQHWNLKTLQVLAFKCCNISDDIFNDIELPVLRNLRLHSCSVARIPDCRPLFRCEALRVVSFDSIFHQLLVDRISGLPPQITTLELVRPAAADIEAVLNLLEVKAEICPKLKLLRFVQPVLGRVQALVSQNLMAIESLRVVMDKRDAMITYRHLVHCLCKW